LKKGPLNGVESPEPLDLRAILQFFTGSHILKNCSGRIFRAQGSAPPALARLE